MDLLVHRALRFHAAFAKCPDDLLREIARRARVERYTKAQRIGHGVESGGPDDVMLVVSGCLRLHRRSSDERASMLTLLGPAEVLFQPGESRETSGINFDCLAHENSVVVHIPFDALQSALRPRPQLWLDVGSKLIEQKRRLAITVASQSNGSALKRIVLILLSHLRREPGGTMVICLSQEDVGSLARLCRQTTNSTLRGLEEAGAVRLSYGRIRVLDAALLSQFACGAPAASASVESSTAVLQ